MLISIEAGEPPVARVREARVRALYEAYNRRAWDAVAVLLDPSVEWFHAGRHELVRGVDGAVAMFRGNADAFPKAKIDLRAVRDAGDAVVVEWNVVNGRAPRRLDARRPAIVCEVFELRAGRVARASTYGDVLTMLSEFRDASRPPLGPVC
ncbi:MAG TPA: nuclear transport factor 2 family protein [Minicystis sp.]|nr:nuclear transport factor 2 family protein [Minicystis sp.]